MRSSAVPSGGVSALFAAGGRGPVHLCVIVRSQLDLAAHHCRYDPDVAGRSFHHGRFVQRMRAAAAAQPTVTMRQAFVKRLINAGGQEWSEGQVRTRSLVVLLISASRLSLFQSVPEHNQRGAVA